MQGCSRHASVRTTGDVMSEMNSRTVEIPADRKPAILDGRMVAINGWSKEKTVKLEAQLD
jgi:hypothetical protein